MERLVWWPKAGDPVCPPLPQSQGSLFLKCLIFSRGLGLDPEFFPEFLGLEWNCINSSPQGASSCNFISPHPFHLGHNWEVAWEDFLLTLEFLFLVWGYHVLHGPLTLNGSQELFLARVHSSSGGWKRRPNFLPIGGG